MSHGEQFRTEAFEPAHVTPQNIAGPESPNHSSAFGSTLSSGSNSASRGIHDLVNMGQADITPEDGRVRILKELERSVESFRSG